MADLSLHSDTECTRKWSQPYPSLLDHNKPDAPRVRIQSKSLSGHHPLPPESIPGRASCPLPSLGKRCPRMALLALFPPGTQFRREAPIVCLLLTNWRRMPYRLRHQRIAATLQVALPFLWSHSCACKARRRLHLLREITAWASVFLAQPFPGMPCDTVLHRVCKGRLIPYRQVQFCDRSNLASSRPTLHLRASDNAAHPANSELHPPPSEQESDQAREKDSPDMLEHAAAISFWKALALHLPVAPPN
mmetsp:Transcript_8012/g.12719  ORF Transcript_8012/g.12719 Transcript_8012/m.12719 type:complete len:248 (-) Transcript_8012:1221-1964(-)